MSPDGKPSGPAAKRAEAGPGGSGAVLGFRLIRYSGVQGAALVAGNLLQLATIGVVAGYLGPSALGRFSLLLFLAALVTMVFSLAAKPGTIRRTFGGDDDEDDDDDDEKAVVSSNPKHTLGAGLLWAVLLGALVASLVIAFRRELADLLLGDAAQGELILWAGVLGGAGILFRVASITLWFERRPNAYLVAEISRSAIGLAVIWVLLVSGGGLSDAIVGAAVGTAAAALGAAVMLRGSFEPNLDPREVVAIIAGGGRRVPIVTSLWVVQNADVFLLSRFVDHTELGIYALASKLGLVVSFLPQGFRMAMRPLRKSAVFKAVRSQYGRPTANGQLLGYFVLLCISSVLIMVLGGEIVVDLAPDSFEDAAPLVPLTAAGLVMPALWRTINGQTAWPGKTRATFVLSTVGAALAFIGVTVALAPEIGVYAAPVAMLVAFLVPVSYFFVRCQLGPNRIDFPYVETASALVAAAAIGGGYHLLPDLPVAVEAVIACGLLGLYVVLLFVLRVVPENHWPALTQMAGSLLSGRADRFNPRRGLRAIEPADRERLRTAATVRMPPPALAEPAVAADPPAREKAKDSERTEGARLVRLLRRVGVSGGAPVMERSRWDGGIAEFLFAAEPVAVRNASMRALLDDGADAGDLRALEDLVGHLASVPDDAWAGARAADSRIARRRRAAGRRGRNAVARAARAIGRRI